VPDAAAEHRRQQRLGLAWREQIEGQAAGAVAGDEAGQPVPGW
jgi:hypothetical protein